MHAPSLASGLIAGKGGLVGVGGCCEGGVVHVHLCDEDDACMDGVNSVIQGSGVMQLHVHLWMLCIIHAGLVVTVSGEEQSV